jgi:hypothetical protein
MNIQHLMLWNANKVEKISIQWEGADFETKFFQSTQMEIEILHRQNLQRGFLICLSSLNWIDLFMTARRKSDEVR